MATATFSDEAVLDVATPIIDARSTACVEI
jgi:hypothetical protein